MPIFDRPNAAFHAYELKLREMPRSEPYVHRDVPTLWERTKAMFAALIASILSVAALVQRARFSFAQRRALVARLQPLESLTRVMLIVEAATYLLMTPEGEKLRRETPKLDPPAPPPPVGVAKAGPPQRILMPGWHTIAALHPLVDPRVAERDRREAAARYEAEAQRREDAEAAARDPATWRCSFTALRWRHDAETLPPQPKRPRFFSYEDTNFPVVSSLVIRKPAPEETSGTLHHGRDLARRIEALARVLANPAPAIRRLARRLAQLQLEDLANPHFCATVLRVGSHAYNERLSAARHVGCVQRALVKAAVKVDPFAPSTHKHDPG